MLLSANYTQSPTDTSVKSKIEPKLSITALACATLLLSACGGGGGGSAGSASTVNASGTAAVGRAIGNSTVSLNCAQGSGTTQTNAAGNYSITISGSAPCVVSIQTNGNTLRSILPSSGRSNITPLTTLLTDYLTARAGQAPNTPEDQLIAIPVFRSLAGNNSAIGDGILAVRTLVLSNYQLDVGTNFLSETIVTPQSGTQNQPDRTLDVLASLNAIEASGLPRAQDRQTISSLGSRAANPSPQSDGGSAFGNSTGTGTGSPISTGTGTGVGTGAGTGVGTGTPIIIGLPIGINTGINSGIDTGINNGIDTGINNGTNNGGVSSARECFNPTLYEIGSRQELSYNLDISGVKIVNDFIHEVKGRTFFEGKNLLEIETRSGQEKFSGFFEADISNAIVTSFGSLGTSLSGGESITTKTVETDPQQNKDATLRAGQSYTEFSRAETVLTFNDRLNKPQEKFTIEQQQQVTYVGREMVTVPAGTFNACKFTERQFNNNAIPVDVIRWMSPQGIQLKLVNVDDKGNQFNSMTLIRGKINGMDIR
ncbi:MAG: hypothetical protein QE278_09345 [Limnobacter sp.]|nr:hypothetical protein [Limnobacter sp.]